MTNCKECGAEVEWLKIKGRWHCHNAGTKNDHWDLCSKRKWQQVKATGKPFEGVVMQSSDTSAVGFASGYANSIHGTKLSRHAIPARRKVKFSGQCKACVPPWEACVICPDRLEAA